MLDLVDSREQLFLLPSRQQLKAEHSLFNMSISRYYNPAFINEQIKSGKHRQVIGGKWEEIGKLRFEFLKAQGLQPEHKFLDVGYGSLCGKIPSRSQHLISFVKDS